MLNTSFSKLFLVILWLVEPNNQSDTHLLKNGNVVVWGEAAIFVSDIERPRKRDEFSRHCPVEVAVLHLFVVLVLYHVEGLIVIPPQLDGKIETIKAMINSAFISACSHSRVSKWSELGMIRSEHFPGLMCRLFQDNDHESTHEKSCIRLLGVVETGVVIYLVGAVLLIIDQLLELLTK